METEERLIELELRFTEQQALLRELSDVIWGQQKALDALAGEVKRLSARLSAERAPLRAPDVADEKPPHY
jgi:SlyX protein